MRMTKSSYISLLQAHYTPCCTFCEAKEKVIFCIKIPNVWWYFCGTNNLIIVPLQETLYFLHQQFNTHLLSQD